MGRRDGKKQFFSRMLKSYRKKKETPRKRPKSTGG